MKKFKYKSNFIIGIDEVGRGALAGPVVVAAFLLKSNIPACLAGRKNLACANLPNGKAKVSMIRQISKMNIKNQNFKIPLRDSKKLTPRQREIWFEYIIKNQKFFYTTALISPSVIDRINISQAANLAAIRALKKLITDKILPITKIKIYLDGGLYLKKQKFDTRYLMLNAKTVIKGDEKIQAITLASIVAKVTRDRLMKKLHHKYPVYGFDQHKGYGTRQHFAAIKKYGLAKVHRLTFCKKTT